MIATGADCEKPAGDREIRARLVSYLEQRDPTAAILHELPLARGECKADIACINGVLGGYEIKSARDSLARLERQATYYATVFEFMTVVVTQHHLAQVRARLPRCWGILTVGEDGGFNRVRQPKRRARQVPGVLARLMWKGECVKILRARGYTTTNNAPIVDLWGALECLPLNTLRAAVRSALKERGSSGSAR